MSASRMPPYWIGWYDRWNVALPLAFLGLLAWVLTLPRPVAAPAGAGVASAPARRPAAAMQPTTMESPANGSRWDVDRVVDVVGRAEPGSTVVLAFLTAPSADWRELARATAGADGRYGFWITRFPPGHHVLRATAWAMNGRTSESALVDVSVTDARATGADQRRRGAGPKK